MINVRKAVKTFGGKRALDGLDINVNKGSIYGLVGTNGAGKTTVIKCITGIQKPDSGHILLDGKSVFENPEVKGRIGYVSDEMYYMPGSTMEDMADYQEGIYPGWSRERYGELIEEFGIDQKVRLSAFSKGMQKQASLILTLPVMRLKAWKAIIDDVAERETTVLLSSHNLREMEGYCDHIGIISDGRMVIERDLEDLKTDVHKVQVAFPGGGECELDRLNICKREQRGSVELMIVKDSYGNALLPMLTGSFENIYLCDIRYFDLNAVDFINRVGATDLLFAMCSFSAVGGNRNCIYNNLTK